MATKCAHDSPDNKIPKVIKALDSTGPKEEFKPTDTI